jgi:ubiquinone/menaquinone biosynthesis C-methylase UbiE
MTEMGTSEEERIESAYRRRATAGVYSFFNPGHLFMIRDQERRMLRALEGAGLSDLSGKKILEIGCGSGFWLRQFLSWGAAPENIHGVDLLAERVSIAKRLCPQTMTISCGNAAKLDYADAFFDVVFQSTVFTSILDNQMRHSVASEMLRVLKPGGIVLWYDYYMNNPNNPDVRAVTKKEILELFTSCDVQLRRVTLAPPIARRLAPLSTLLCHLLAKLKIFNTHYLGVIRKKREVS